MNERRASDPATLRDVAKQAGVSLGTASQALNNRGNVAPETRAKVLEAANLLGYQHRARDVSVQPHRSIGMIVKQDDAGPMAINPFYSHVLAGVERECQRQNLSLMYASVDVDSLNRPTSMPPMLSNERLDGILVVGAFLEDAIMQFRQQVDMPIVLVDAYAPGKEFDSVVTDNLNGAYTAVCYLIDQGHQHIGLVGSLPDAYPSIRERRKGYLRALKHRGITETYIEDSMLSRASGYDATCSLLQKHPQITAIFACNDDVAIGVIHAAREMNRDVPRNFSVIGFDDIDLAQEVTPALTTIHVDKVLMGVIAVRYVRERAENPDRSALTTTLSTQLIIRDSVRVPNREAGA